MRKPFSVWGYHVRQSLTLCFNPSVIQKAAELGMFVVIDLHGAPGAQKLKEAFTGQVSPSIQYHT
jgi:hypothetical protein